eukprot:gnl/Chilomastix_cuspidata/1666.p1 GENE.gnl/Chilomastix_cuspidata/1666~~gnl/Chilomastix_cuspidata/1666.p1  ORF type:complete len:519 (+),score=107.21 gnl/Chilomastix_cuspidata/1666:29-1585(+)
MATQGDAELPIVAVEFHTWNKTQQIPPKIARKNFLLAIESPLSKNWHLNVQEFFTKHLYKSVKVFSTILSENKYVSRIQEALERPTSDPCFHTALSLVGNAVFTLKTNSQLIRNGLVRRLVNLLRAGDRLDPAYPLLCLVVGNIANTNVHAYTHVIECLGDGHSAALPGYEQYAGIFEHLQAFCPDDSRTFAERYPRILFASVPKGVNCLANRICGIDTLVGTLMAPGLLYEDSKASTLFNAEVFCNARSFIQAQLVFVNAYNKLHFFNALGVFLSDISKFFLRVQYADAARFKELARAFLVTAPELLADENVCTAFNGALSANFAPILISLVTPFSSTNSGTMALELIDRLCYVDDVLRSFLDAGLLTSQLVFVEQRAVANHCFNSQIFINRLMKFILVHILRRAPSERTPWLASLVEASNALSQILMMASHIGDFKTFSYFVEIVATLDDICPKLVDGLIRQCSCICDRFLAIETLRSDVVRLLTIIKKRISTNAETALVLINRMAAFAPLFESAE